MEMSAGGGLWCDYAVVTRSFHSWPVVQLHLLAHTVRRLAITALFARDTGCLTLSSILDFRDMVYDRKGEKNQSVSPHTI